MVQLENLAIRYTKNMKLGVFDSGIGGDAVAAALQTTFPTAEILVVNDKLHIPYGDKSSGEVIALTDAAIQPILAAACDIIVIACNTATALALSTLRTRYPQQKFIGIEPMIKSAAILTKTGTIAVCATPATLASERYKDLVLEYGADLNIIEPDCRSWASMIENNELNIALVEETIANACDHGADVIVLGCTHYHWIKDEIISITKGRAVVIEPSEAIGNRVKQLLES